MRDDKTSAVGTPPDGQFSGFWATAAGALGDSRICVVKIFVVFRRHPHPIAVSQTGPRTDQRVPSHTSNPAPRPYGHRQDQYMKGTAACNTTRDYIKSAVFMVRPRRESG